MVCISGEGHPAGEDMRGADEWVELQEAILEPAELGSEKHKEQKELVIWYDRRCSNADVNGAEGLTGDGFWRWDIRAVNKELENLDDMDESDFTEEDFAETTEQGTETEETDDDDQEAWEGTETEDRENGETEEPGH